MDTPVVRKPEYVVAWEMIVPELPRELKEAVASQMDVAKEALAEAGDPSELLVRFDKLDDAIDVAKQHEGARVYRLGPQVFPRKKE